jgi:hypothetical protein
MTPGNPILCCGRICKGAQLPSPVRGSCGTSVPPEAGWVLTTAELNTADLGAGMLAERAEPAPLPAIAANVFGNRGSSAPDRRSGSRSAAHRRQTGLVPGPAGSYLLYIPDARPRDTEFRNQKAVGPSSNRRPGSGPGIGPGEVPTAAQADRCRPSRSHSAARGRRCQCNAAIPIALPNRRAHSSGSPYLRIVAV